MKQTLSSCYPIDIPRILPDIPFRSLIDLLEDAFTQHAKKTAFCFMGSKMSFGKLNKASRAFANYLQSLGLKRGDRIALMMPNILQYPVAAIGALQAGLTIVNMNPLYTKRELEEQLKDSQAIAIVILETMASTLSSCLSQLSSLRHIIITSLGDMLPSVKGILFNSFVRYIKKSIPPYRIIGAIRWNDALRYGRKLTFKKETIDSNDIALLQYTGGTTGIPKGVMLTHNNLVSNIIQSELWYNPIIKKIPKPQQIHVVCALPLYHIFGFTINMLLFIRKGACNILIPDPRNITSLLKEIAKYPCHCFPAVNTLFSAIARNPHAKKMDWSSLILSVAGGMAVQDKTIKSWQNLTNTTIITAYGLSEASPAVSCPPVVFSSHTGTAGYPLPSTIIHILDDDGNEKPVGEIGEIAIKGPQIMLGYWNKPEETAKVMTKDGFLRTGDIGSINANGELHIIDRKKDMINVSGYNVYPNEIEEVILKMPGILDAAAVGVPDDFSGEAVNLFLVRADHSITEQQVKLFCRENLTGFKRPRKIFFKDTLPKTSLGKNLRRELTS